MKLNKYIFLAFFPLFVNSSVYAENNTLDSGSVNNETINQNNISNTTNAENTVNSQSQNNNLEQSNINEQQNLDNTTINNKADSQNQNTSNNTQSENQVNTNKTDTIDVQNNQVNNQQAEINNSPQTHNVQVTAIPKKSDWVNNQASNLYKNGVFKMPDQVDYDSLVSQKDFAIMLSKVTNIKDKSIFGDLDPQGFDKPLSRAMAIDAALRAFGLEKEMNKVVENYQTKFKDLNPNQKYYKASLTAEIIKLSAGYPDKTFRPDDLLKWSEGVAIVESVYRWASLMPEQTPIQKAEDLRKNIWYYFIDGFRLILTSVYCLLSVIFLFRAWKRSKQDKSGLRPIIASLCFATAFLFIMWLNEMLYGRGLIEKAVYYIISTISILAGMFLIRTSNLISKQTEPKPKANIEVGYVDHIDMNRGEMFVIDSITKRRMLALISSDTKVYSKENRLLGTAFLSELSAGDFVSIKGTEQINGGAIVDVDMILVLASKQANINTRQQKQVVEEQETNKTQARYRKVN
ncbi:MAG: hypothetical protein U0354_12715 [Candidatus Sericytochromatia bacterium]